MWTLSTELSFYALLPLILWPWRRAPIVGASTILALAFGSFWISTNVVVDWNYQSLPAILIRSVIPYFWIFALGIGARLAWPRLSRLFEGQALWWIVAYAALGIGWSLSGNALWLDYKYQPNWLTACRIIALAGLVLSVAFTWKGLAGRLLRGLDLSYGLYLFHFPIISVALSLGFSGNWLAWPAIYCLSLFVAYLSSTYVESPFLTKRRHTPGDNNSSSDRSVEIVEHKAHLAAARRCPVKLSKQKLARL